MLYFIPSKTVVAHPEIINLINQLFLPISAFETNLGIGERYRSSVFIMFNFLFLVVLFKWLYMLKLSVCKNTQLF